MSSRCGHSVGLVPTEYALRIGYRCGPPGVWSFDRPLGLNFSVAIGPALGPLLRPTARMPMMVSMPLPMIPNTNVSVGFMLSRSSLDRPDNGEGGDRQDEEHQHHEGDPPRRRVNGGAPGSSGGDHDR